MRSRPLSCDSAMQEKSDLRQEARARREALARAMPDFPSQLARFADRLPLPGNAVVAGYWPTKSEADPRALMLALSRNGYPLALPCVEKKDAVLIFRSWYEDHCLVANIFGLEEPEPHRAIVVPSVVFVPLLAFDAAGHRLGYGGGYYDRTLAALPGAAAIGIAYAGQEMASLPREAHDHPLDAILTEQGLRRFVPAL
ncbi:MAG TPA: 5-formyltetrahydrofolate cyclo-ligase [Rhizomicrobium sp.]|nr:5-formyltetrahydrofolate cyclo-ligase [Rhizomicrobium sp.]